MVYSKLSTATLKDFHDAIRRCLDEDDSTPQGEMKPYGVREYPDWKEQLDSIEAELLKRSETFSPISITPTASSPKPMPVELVLYERIKAHLAYEDSLSAGSEKPYGVRKYYDWKQQADEFEQVLEGKGITFTKIRW